MNNLIPNILCRQTQMKKGKSNSHINLRTAGSLASASVRCVGRYLKEEGWRKQSIAFLLSDIGRTRTRSSIQPHHQNTTPSNCTHSNYQLPKLDSHSTPSQCGKRVRKRASTKRLDKIQRLRASHHDNLIPWL